jgi:hypothetical protein
LVWGGVVRDIPAFCRELVTALAEQERSSYTIEHTSTEQARSQEASPDVWRSVGLCRGGCLRCGLWL